jgi:hypothetical protein
MQLGVKVNVLMFLGISGVIELRYGGVEQFHHCCSFCCCVFTLPIVACVAALVASSFGLVVDDLEQSCMTSCAMTQPKFAM